MKRITVLISKNHPVFRRALRLLLEAEDIDVLDEAENGLSAVNKAKSLHPDVVVMDLGIPLLNGVEATRKIAKEAPATKVLILSTYCDGRHVREAVDAGAAGYVTKDRASEELLPAIREVCNGNAFFSPPSALRLLNHWRNRGPGSATAPLLTSRQKEVLKWIAEGFSSREIASLLSVSIKTVEKHRQAAMDRLDIHEIAGLTRYAVSSGVVSSNCALTRPTNPTPARGEPIASVMR